MGKSLLIKYHKIMQIFAAFLPKSAFARNVTTLAAGTAAAQVLTVMVSPVLTRLYGPDAFGVFGVLFAAAGIVAIISTLQFDMAAVLPEDEADGISLIFLASILGIAAFALCLAVTIVCKGSLAFILGFPEHENILWSLAFLMLGMVGVRVLSHWALRCQNFFLISLSSLVAAVSTSIFKVGGGLLGYGAPALLIGGTIGYFFQIVCLAPAIPKNLLGSQMKSDGWLNMRRVAKKHRDFAIFRTPQITLNTLSSNLPGILFATLFSPTEAGLYFIAYRVLQMPGHFVADAVRKAFYPRAAKIANTGGNLRPAIVKATMVLGLVGAIPLFVILAFGPFLFSFVFGEQWIIAGEYARWLCLWIFAAFMNGPSVSAIPVIGKQAVFLIYEILYSIAKAIAITGAALMTHDALMAIAAYAMVGFLANSFLIFYTVSKCPMTAMAKPPVDETK